VQDCGHDAFCFGCIQGHVVCPLCQVRITKWERTTIKPQVNPLIRSLQDAREEPGADSLIAQPSQKIRKGGAPVAEAAAEKVIMNSPVHVPDEYRSDSDEDDEGLQHWYSDDVFSEGGMRSMVLEEQNKPAGTSVASTLLRSEIRDDSCTAVAADIHAKALESEVPTGNTKLKRKPISGPNTDDIENHTRVAKKSITEILSAAPTLADKGVANTTRHVSTAGAQKRKPGRPPSAMKQLAQVLDYEGKSESLTSQPSGRKSISRQSGRLTVPSKFKDL
jgi:hypothetical protein